MAPETYQRKLTAILSADVEGYSRLMGDDEAATVRTLSAYREIMTSLIKQHRGRVVDSPGDNVLAEFASVVDAVQCSVSVQKEFQARNAELPADRRMEFRIGINLGDVIEEGDRIYGDGVNIAARLEALANPGGICISKTAFDHIESKLPLGYEFLGDQTVKNIAKPVGAYRVTMDPRVSGVGKRATLKRWTAGWRGVTLAGAIVVVIAIAGVLVWNFYFRRPSVEPASIEKMAFPLPQKPSIAVLPFDNLSGDPEQNWFIDGFTENVITTLSKDTQLFVISRKSSFTYKGKSVKIKQVSEDLGVRYVLEGSIQRSGDQLRITAQLIDAISGYHLWSERYDRKMKDIFELQDEITLKIAKALQVKLTQGEGAGGSTKNLDAWGLYTKAVGLWRSPPHGKEKIPKVRKLCEEAIKLDPNYSRAWYLLGSTYFWVIRKNWTKTPEEDLKRVIEIAQKASSLDETNFEPYALLTKAYMIIGKWDEAIAAGEKAIALGPSNPSSYSSYGRTLRFAGRFEEAIEMYEMYDRLLPYKSSLVPLFNKSLCFFQLGRYEEALKSAEFMHKRRASTGSLYCLILANVGLGQIEKAQEYTKEYLKRRPNHSVDKDRILTFYRYPEHGVRQFEALRKAGMPEHSPLPLPDKPSIAVLAFENMSGDPEQEYFSDGLSEEIITALSKTPKLFVIARNSSFTYKGKPVKVQQVGRELGVKYVLEGSVRKSGDRVRITSQLVDSKTGNHLWAERYDRKLEDIFSIQDEITKKIITELRVKLTEGEQARIYAKGTDNLEAYLKLMQVTSLLVGKPEKARQLAKEAIALDPNWPLAYCFLGRTHISDVFYGMTKNRAKSLEQALELNKKALALDEKLGTAHYALSLVYTLRKQFEKSIEHGKLSVELEPNSAHYQASLGRLLMNAGKPEESIPLYENSIRRDPYARPNSYYNYGYALWMMGRYEEAVAAGKEARNRGPNDIFSHMLLALTYIELGRVEDAQSSAAEVLRIKPNFTLEWLAKMVPWKNKNDVNRMIENLRKAGLPEK